MNRPLPHHEFDALTEDHYAFSRENFDAWKLNKSRERQEIYEIEKVLKFEKSNYYKYLTYLKSEEWRSKRSAVLKRDGGVCQGCRNASATEIHHITYENLFQEPLEDLISYCQPCHKKAHNRG